LLAQAGVVDLAGRAAADGRRAEDPARSLVVGQTALDVGNDLGLVYGLAGGRFHPGEDELAETLVGNADHDGVANTGVFFERLLDLLGIDLLAARVDAHRAPPEKAEGAVGLDRGVVARHRV